MGITQLNGIWRSMALFSCIIALSGCSYMNYWAVQEEYARIQQAQPGQVNVKHLIDQEALATMGSHAFLINTARGEVVDEYALASALGEGEIAGAGLDVYENEPSINPALLKFENLVLLPHMGSGTNETREAMGLCAFDNIKAYLNGVELPNRVV